MARNKKLLILATMLCAVALVSSACDINVLPIVDCSGVNQPDSGGLVCLGLNAAALNVIALLFAAIFGLGSTAM